MQANASEVEKAQSETRVEKDRIEIGIARTIQERYSGPGVMQYKSCSLSVLVLSIALVALRRLVGGSVVSHSGLYTGSVLGAT